MRSSAPAAAAAAPAGIRPTSSAPATSIPREAAVALPHDGRDLARRLDVRADEIHVERDQRPARAHDHAAGGGIETLRAEIRSHLACVDPPLQLTRAAAPEEGGPAPHA